MSQYSLTIPLVSKWHYWRYIISTFRTWKLGLWRHYRESYKLGRGLPTGNWWDRPSLRQGLQSAKHQTNGDGTSLPFRVESFVILSSYSFCIKLNADLSLDLVSSCVHRQPLTFSSTISPSIETTSTSGINLILIPIKSIIHFQWFNRFTILVRLS